jgi:hypothetical protein
MRWGLETTRSTTHLDYQAALISGSNVPSMDDNHVSLAKSYFNNNMRSE